MGYSEGCSDAGRDLKGLNGHGYDESVHHGDTQFRTGYVNGYRTCWSNSGVGEEPGEGGNYIQPRQPQSQLPKLQPPPQLQPPSQQPSGFLRLGPYWWKVCNDYDSIIIEPCGRLVTPDGYALTSEGVSVLACFAGGSLALVYPQLLQYSSLSGQGSGEGGNYQQPTPQLQPQPSPSYPNYNWIQLCSLLDPVLVSPCNQLVNRDNTLTSEGYRGYVCIQNGIILAGGGALLAFPREVIIVTLQALSAMTGCDGIVDWRSINDVTDLRNIIRIFSK